MTFLPIVARELRVASRRAATYWTRFAFALVAIVAGSFAWAILFRQSPRETGYWLFVWLAVLAYIYSLVSGCLATADGVSEEKREGTLGLLFLTDLRSYDIVLGKLAASSVTSIYGLLALFPIMGVPLLLGGVAPAEFWRVVVVCLNNLFFSLALGLACSTICKDERKSIGLTLLLLLLIVVGWPAVLAWMASTIGHNHPLSGLFRHHPEPLLVFSPGFACVFAFEAASRGRLSNPGLPWFYISLAITHAGAWLSLLLTTFLLPRVWRDRAATPGGVRRAERWRLWAEGSGEARAALRRRRLEINPFYWLASRDHFKVTLVWLWIGAGALIWAVGLARWKRDWLDIGAYVMTALCAHTLLKCWVAMEASKRLGDDRRSGALELLLSTPLGVREILRGQWLALLRQFGAAAALICAVDLLFLGLGFKRMFNDNDRGFWVAMCLAGIAVFVLDLMALALHSTWLSLRGRRTSRAGLTAVARVCVVPWFLFGAFGAFMVMLEVFFRIRPFGRHDEYWLLGVWFALALLNDLLLGVTSHYNLKLRFRDVATERPESRPGFWARLAGRKPAG